VAFGVRRSARRGFTLVELGAVVVVLGALSLTAIPALRGIDLARAAADRERTLAALCAARRLATASGTPHGVTFGPGGATAALERWPEGAAGAERAEDALGAEDAGWALGADPVATVAGVAGDPAVWFDADGAPLASDPGTTMKPALTTVEVRFASGETIAVTARTGMVTP